jgi:hypothetical protein
MSNLDMDGGRLPADWTVLVRSARRHGWELGRQSRYGGPWACYAWGNGQDRMIGTFDQAREWVAGLGAQQTSMLDLLKEAA